MLLAQPPFQIYLGGSCYLVAFNYISLRAAFESELEATFEGQRPPLGKASFGGQQASPKQMSWDPWLSVVEPEGEEGGEGAVVGGG